MRQAGEQVEPDVERIAITALWYIGVTGDAEKIDDALELFQQTFPRISIARDFRGGFYYSLGEFEKAAREFEEAVRLDPRGWMPYVNLTRSYSAVLAGVVATAATASARQADAVEVPSFCFAISQRVALAGKHALGSSVVGKCE